MSSSTSSFEQAAVAGWSKWLVRYLVTLAVLAAALALFVVVMDPFSTGRFALTQRIDITTSNPRLSDAALVRDKRFNGAIFGDSVAIGLDPQAVASQSKWRLLQLAMFAASAREVTTVASAFERHHSDGSTLEIFVVDSRWCSDDPKAQDSDAVFPAWLYNSNDATYLANLQLSSEAVVASVTRLQIWAGLVQPPLREDGYAPWSYGHNAATFIQTRPVEAAAPTAPMPALDVLAAHISALGDNRALAVVFAPQHVSVLPVPGSAAAVRLEACKQRVHDMVARRPRAAYLDLMIDNPLAQDAENFTDPLHLDGRGLPSFAAGVAQLIEHSGLKPD